MTSRFYIQTLCSLCMSALLTLSCSDDSKQASDGHIPATFVTTISNSTAGNTRVVDQTWSGTETVGIYMMPTGGSLPEEDLELNTYRPNASGTDITLVPTTKSQTLYYPVNASDVDFIAFSPYKLITKPSVEFNITNQSDPASVESMDFIWAKATGHNKYNPTVNMTFAHKQSKITIVVTANTDIAEADMSNPTLKIENIPGSATYYLSNGELFGLGSISDFTPCQREISATSVTWEAIIPPHVGSDYGFRRLTFTFGGTTYRYEFPQSQDFESGKAYHYNLTLTTSGLQLANTRVANWEVGEATWKTTGLTVDETLVELEGSEAANNVVDLSTNSLNKPKIELSYESSSVTTDKPNWIKNAKLVANGRVDGVSGYTLKYDVTEAGKERTGYIHLSVDGVTKVIEVKQDVSDLTDGMTNCYLLSSGESVTFPVRRAFKCTTKTTSNILRVDGTACEDLMGVSTLWTTNNSLISSAKVVGTGPDAEITVATRAGQYGNAVIRLYRSGGYTLWSYHIWVPETDVVTNSGGWMDRNLGATTSTPNTPTTLGLYYQWGRKDPFPGASKTRYDDAGYGTETTYPTFSATVSETNTLRESIEKPLTHIKGWTGSDDIKSWSCDFKTCYDPCPVGYRTVDPQTTTGWDAPTNNGRYNETYGGYYPSTGLRHINTGEVMYTGGEFRNWSGMGHTDGGVSLAETGALKFGLWAVARGLGCVTRCMKEN